MHQRYDPKTFLTTPQGPRLEGVARDRARHLLDQSIKQRRVRLIARILTRDPSLITEKCGETGFYIGPVVEKTLVARMDVFAQFALEHGVPVTDPCFGKYGLLDSAIDAVSPGLVSIALLYGVDPNQAMIGHPDCTHHLDSTFDDAPCYPLMRVVKNVLNRDDMFADNRSFEIAYMLLDAGANPSIPVVANFVLGRLCLEDHPSGRLKHKLMKLFAAVLKAGGKECLTTHVNDKPLLYFAAEAGNMDAMRRLLAAGADPEDAHLSSIFKNQGREERIGQVAALRQRYLAQLSQKETAPAHGPAPRNYPPADFFRLAQGPRTVGAERDGLRQMLEMAIGQKRVVTAAKILAKDPSLITETLTNAIGNKWPALELAINAGMTALVPSALAQGVEVTDPVFGAPAGLLDKACTMRSRALASYALLHHIKPNAPGMYSLLGEVLNNMRELLKTDAFKESIPIAEMLMGAGARLRSAEERQTMLAILSTKVAGAWESDLDDVLAILVKREGRAHADLIAAGRPILSLAAEKGRIKTVKALIAAGANTDRAFLGADLFTLIKACGGEKHLPALTEMLVQRQIAKNRAGALAPSVTIIDRSESSQKRNVGNVF